MDLTISALALALIGLGLAIFAIVTGLIIALRSRKSKSLVPDGLYRMRKIGEDGIDMIFEIEEISSSKEASNGSAKEVEPAKQEAVYRRKAS